MVYYGELGKKVKCFWNKISLTGCKWSNSNVPRSETPNPAPGVSFTKCYLTSLFLPLLIPPKRSIVAQPLARCQHKLGDEKLHLLPRYDKAAERAPNNKKVEVRFEKGLEK